LKINQQQTIRDETNYNAQLVNITKHLLGKYIYFNEKIKIIRELGNLSMYLKFNFKHITRKKKIIVTYDF